MPVPYGEIDSQRCESIVQGKLRLDKRRLDMWHYVQLQRHRDGPPLAIAGYITVD